MTQINEINMDIECNSTFLTEFFQVAGKPPFNRIVLPHALQ